RTKELRKEIMLRMRELDERKQREWERQSVETKPYRYQKMSFWLKRLLARSDIEELMNRKIVSVGDRLKTVMRDFWHGTVVQSFKGPDGKSFFSSTQEGRYTFSLNVDGFNPQGSSHSGRSASVTAMYMVCLELPPSLRYKIQNVYLVAIIP
ncbi:hypothetical protein SISNIDRAFT_402371, partial [Sistotremastrum niveocremeum HHB9708]